MADRDDYIREFKKAAADSLAQIAFNNAVHVARKAGISDQELAGVTGIRVGDFAVQLHADQGVISRRTDSAGSPSMRATRRACRSISRARAGSTARFLGNAASRNLGEARDRN
jgi:hypothetical protein